jgi:hypothetical protein
LRGRAGGTGKPQGQWLDNDKAAEFLRKQRGAIDETQLYTDVDIPDGLGQVIMPDGSIRPATKARLIPKASGGYETTYPI